MTNNKNIFMSKSSGETWYQEGHDFFRRDFGEHTDDVSIIPTANIVSTVTGQKVQVTLQSLHLHFEKIDID